MSAKKISMEMENPKFTLTKVSIYANLMTWEVLNGTS